MAISPVLGKLTHMWLRLNEQHGTKYKHRQYTCGPIWIHNKTDKNVPASSRHMWSHDNTQHNPEHKPIIQLCSLVNEQPKIWKYISSVQQQWATKNMETYQLQCSSSNWNLWIEFLCWASSLTSWKIRCWGRWQLLVCWCTKQSTVQLRCKCFPTPCCKSQWSLCSRVDLLVQQRKVEQGRAAAAVEQSGDVGDIEGVLMCAPPCVAALVTRSEPLNMQRNAPAASHMLQMRPQPICKYGSTYLPT